MCLLHGIVRKLNQSQYSNSGFRTLQQRAANARAPVPSSGAAVSEFVSMLTIKQLRTLAAVAALLVFSVVGAAQINAPVLLPGDVTPAPAAGRQENPQIARGADSYLAVWADTRTAIRSDGFIVGFSGPYTGTGLGTMIDIYAARLDAAGNVIDQTPIVVNEAQYNQGYPRVAWNGQNWLVVWLTEHEDNRYAYDLLGARIAPDGTRLDPTPIVIAANASAQIFPQNLIVDGAGNSVVVWDAFSPGSSVRSVYVARITPAGTVLDPGGKIAYTHTSQNLGNTDLAFAGDGYLLTFIDYAAGPNFENLVKGVRLTASLTQAGTPVRLNNNLDVTSPKKPRVSSDGTNYFVVWGDDPGSLTRVLGVRVAHNGTVLDQTPLTVAANAGTGAPSLSIAWDGTNWHVAYDSDYNPANDTYGDTDIYDTRVSSAGAVLDPQGIGVSAAPGYQNEAAVTPALGGGGARLVWFDQRAELDIYTAGVAGATAGASTPVALGAPRQLRPRMAAGGPGFLVVYRSTSASVGRVLAQRLDPNGNVIDNTPLVVTTGLPSVNNPAVAWNGAEFLIVWQADAGAGLQTFGRRLTSAGAFLDAAPFLIMNGDTPDVGALGDTFLVSNILQPTSQLRYVQAVRVSSAGAVLGSPVTLQFNFNFGPRVATVGNRWLVVWEYHARHDVSASSVNGAFVNADGTTPGYFIVSSGSSGSAPHLASAGDTALVAWSASNNILARRIQADGTLLDGTPGITITNAINLQTAPAVAWDGAQYILDWLDQRNESYPIQPRGDIYGARVTATGFVLEEFALANSQLPEETPFVVAANGQTVFAYAKFYDNAPYTAHHITLRTARFAAPAGGTVPLAPSNLVGTRVAGNVSLAWTDNSTDEAGFKIETSATGASPWTQFATTAANVTTLDNIGVGQTQSYYFRVRAYSSAGDSAYSNVAAPPYATITAPEFNQTFAAHTNITVSADAFDADGTISRVEFYAGPYASPSPLLIGTATVAPYSIVWNNVPDGTYYLTARAVDNQGQTGTSSEVGIIVRNAFFNITGHVSAPTGAGLPGVGMTLGGDQAATTTTDANGDYSFSGLASGLYFYTVTPTRAGYGFDPTYQSVYNVSADQTANFTAVSSALGPVLISEFRLRGPNGAGDEFIELYNNSDADVTVNAVDGSQGWGIMAQTVDGSVHGYVAMIPNGTVIPARGHYLLTDAMGSSSYSLTATAGDVAYAHDLADNTGIALFRTADQAQFTAANRLDAVGFSSGGVYLDDNLFREGAGLALAPTFANADEQYSFARKLTSGTPQDTGDNAADFALVSTNGTVGGTPAILGAPGPENLASPIQRNAQLKATLVDVAIASTVAPNRVRDNAAVGPNAPLGTLTIRRKFVNRTGRIVSGLRFRIVDITTLNTPNPGGAQADLRLLDSQDVMVTLSGGGTTLVKGTTVELPQQPAQGGGLHSALVVALPGGTLAPNASVSVQFVLGVQQGGSFRFTVNVEALP